MAVTLTLEQLRGALRLGDSPEETAEATRLLSYASTAVVKYAPNAPDNIHDEAVVRLSGYLFDQPTSTRGDMYAAAGRNSGAWAILAPYKIRRAGSIGEAVDVARETGTTGNPVINVEVLTAEGELVVTFANGTTTTYSLPAGMGGTGGVDAIARAAAARAQTAADGAARTGANAQATGNLAQVTADQAIADITAHEATTHNHDQIAREAAASAQATAISARSAANSAQLSADGAGVVANNAQTTADEAAAELAAHEATPHNTDTVAREAAASAQATADQAAADLVAHEASPHNTDTVARDLAANAVTVANEAVSLATAADNAILAHEREPHISEARINELIETHRADENAHHPPGGVARTDLYSDTSDYGRQTDALIFRQLTLSRAPVAGRGLQVVIRNVAIGTGANLRWPLDAGSTDDWLGLTVLNSAQLAGTADGPAVTAANCMAFKVGTLHEADSESDGESTIYVGRVSDTVIGIGFEGNHGVHSTFRMIVRETP